VKYYANPQVNVANVQVDLTGPLGATVQTDAVGAYGASSIPLGTWNLTPAKTGGFGSAISSLDAARVLQVVAGLQGFSALQRLACDVTGDGNLSALDAVRILQFSAGVIDRLPVADACKSDWIFSPSPAAPGQTIAPSVSGGVCQQGGILISQLLDPAANQNFDAVLFGDCTGNWSSATGGSLRRLARQAVVHAGYARRTPGNRVRVPIYVQASAPFQALDLAISFDSTALAFVSARLRDDDGGALLSARNDPAGSLAISVASGAPIDPRDGAVLLLEFAGKAAGDCAAARLTGASVDEQPARILTHDACR
jgi:hypothetical protein